MKEHAACGVLTTRGTTIDANPADIVIRILRGHSAMPEDPIRETGVLEVLPAHVMECLGTIGRAHTVHLHDNETQFRERGETTRRAEGLGHKRALRSGVDLLDDGIFFIRIEIPG